MISINLRKNNKKAKIKYKNTTRKFWELFDFRLYNLVPPLVIKNPFDLIDFYNTHVLEWAPIKEVYTMMVGIEYFITEDSQYSNVIFETAVNKIMIEIKNNIACLIKNTSGELNETELLIYDVFLSYLSQRLKIYTEGFKEMN